MFYSKDIAYIYTLKSIKSNIMAKQEINKKIGSKIRAFRQAYGYSQQDLADKVGVSRSTLGNIETGADPTRLEVYYKISDALNVKIHDLIPNNL